MSHVVPAGQGVGGMAGHSHWQVDELQVWLPLHWPLQSAAQAHMQFESQISVAEQPAVQTATSHSHIIVVGLQRWLPMHGGQPISGGPQMR